MPTESAAAWPYCEQDGCHSAHTMAYHREIEWNGYEPSSVRVAGWSLNAPVGTRRWCKAHALIHEGWCVG